MVDMFNDREEQKILCIVPINVKFKPDSPPLAILRFYNLIQLRERLSIRMVFPWEK